MPIRSLAYAADGSVALIDSRGQMKALDVAALADTKTPQEAIDRVKVYFAADLGDQVMEVYVDPDAKTPTVRLYIHDATAPVMPRWWIPVSERG